MRMRDRKEREAPHIAGTNPSSVSEAILDQPCLMAATVRVTAARADTTTQLNTDQRPNHKTASTKDGCVLSHEVVAI